MHLTGEVGGRALRAGVPIVDMLTGYNTTVGVLAALHERGQTGVGRHVEVSLMDAGLAALLNHQTGVLMGGQNPGRGGNRHYSIAPYESYTCADGDIIVAAANDKLYAGVCRVIGRPELIDDPRFVTNTIRRQNLEELNEILEPAFAANTRRIGSRSSATKTSRAVRSTRSAKRSTGRSTWAWSRSSPGATTIRPSGTRFASTARSSPRATPASTRRTHRRDPGGGRHLG